jgi:hypothetical protein
MTLHSIAYSLSGKGNAPMVEKPTGQGQSTGSGRSHTSGPAKLGAVPPAQPPGWLSTSRLTLSPPLHLLLLLQFLLICRKSLLGSPMALCGPQPIL